MLKDQRGNCAVSSRGRRCLPLTPPSAPPNPGLCPQLMFPDHRGVNNPASAPGNQVFPPKLRTLEDEQKVTQVRRMLDMCIDPAQGLASKWDYGNSEWKK
ncbi:UNVERIFIED_CONTAM: hypothetical protein K2H54_074165 [Gekko kuhli]